MLSTSVLSVILAMNLTVVTPLSANTQGWIESALNVIAGWVNTRPASPMPSPDTHLTDLVLPQHLIPQPATFNFTRDRAIEQSA